MKKWLPYLWLYPVVAFIISFLIMVNEDSIGTGSSALGAILMALCAAAELIVALRYSKKRENLIAHAIVAGPVLYLVSIIPNLKRLSDAGMGALIFPALPAVCAVMFMITIEKLDSNKETAKVPQAAAIEQAPVAVAPVVKETEKPAASGKVPVEELKQLKELLDMGAITQEEYDTKKKQLLGL